jgi:hypothetical protein
MEIIKSHQNQKYIFDMMEWYNGLVIFSLYLEIRT